MKMSNDKKIRDQVKFENKKLITKIDLKCAGMVSSDSFWEKFIPRFWTIEKK